MQVRPRENSEGEYSVVSCSPALTSSHIDPSTQGMDEVVIIGYANCIVPSHLAPVIKQRTDEGVAVFILSNNPADEAGPARLKYDAGSDSVQAGAVLLQKVNIKHLNQVLAQINWALHIGLRGGELSEYIQSLFMYQEGETSPPEEWNTPEGIEFITRLMRQTLVRIGLQGGELEAELDRWRNR